MTTTGEERMDAEEMVATAGMLHNRARGEERMAKAGETADLVEEKAAMATMTTIGEARTDVVAMDAMAGMLRSIARGMDLMARAGGMAECATETVAQATTTTIGEATMAAEETVVGTGIVVGKGMFGEAISGETMAGETSDGIRRLPLLLIRTLLLLITIRILQRPSLSIRILQRPSLSIRILQHPSFTIRIRQLPIRSISRATRTRTARAWIFRVFFYQLNARHTVLLRRESRCGADRCGYFISSLLHRSQSLWVQLVHAGQRAVICGPWEQSQQNHMVFTLSEFGLVISSAAVLVSGAAVAANCDRFVARLVSGLS